MPVGELFLSAFLQVLFDRLASRELLNFATGEGVVSKLKKWEKTLKMIQAVLRHAEEKQLTDDAVKMWLDDLQDLAYDAEDILDEFETDALRRKMKAENRSSTSSKVRNLFPACCSGLTPAALQFNTNMGSKIDRISNQLEELCEKRNALGLKEISGGTATTVWKRPDSTSLTMEPAVFGREKDKAKILQMVLSEGSSEAKFCVIPIVGMGGIGKTTLAREVYNDDRVIEVFKTRAWTCVSDDFDVLRISKAIFESISTSTCTLTNLNEVQVQLKNKIGGKKFLLILDDVWSRDYDLWEALKSPFLAGAPGSKIIVTTRSKDVASTMELEVCYNLELLPEDACWAIFEKHVSRSRVITAGKNMELIREKVFKKCKGLPLAARTLAGLLRSKQKYDEWVDILDSEIWDLPEESNIIPVLKLSYYHLPSHLKRCFTYCAIFPKDYEFKKKELVLLWMAEGLIQQSNHKKQLEDVGGEYFCELLSRSIFQQLSNDSLKFVMHDLVHDLAQWISRETSFRFEDASSVMQIKRCDRIRHSSYTFREFEVEKNFEFFCGVEQLRTFLRIFLPPKLIFYRSHVSQSVFPNLLPKLRNLRSLSLKNYHVIELPDSIGDLKHLRYLNLSNTQITNLPESTSSIFNLQSLLLSCCSHLKKLPLQMGDLINLRHLDIRGAILIREMPLGVKKLKCLQTLSNFVVGKDAGSSLKDLKELKFIRGELYISRLENATDCHEARDYILCDKKDLEVLVLEWIYSNASQGEAEKIVLDNLQPHRNLRELTINNFGGKKLSSWIGDPSFSNMVVLKLDGCESCITLPSIGQLSALKNLTIKGMKVLKKVGCEIYGERCSECFQSLETLCFENLPEWEHWDPFEGKKHVEKFSCLKELSISQCPKLSGRLPNRLLSLEKLVISDCEQLVVSFTSLPMLCWLQINRCKGLVCNSPNDSQTLNPLPLLETVMIKECEELMVSFSTLPVLRSLEIKRCKGSDVAVFRSLSKDEFQKLETLKIVGCEDLIQLWPNVICPEKPPQGLGLDYFILLKELHLIGLPNLVSFPDGSLSSVTKVKIWNCEAITSLHEGLNLKHNNARIEYLSVERCPSLMFIVRGRLPSSLKTLGVVECEKMGCIWDDSPACTSSPSSSYSLMQEDVVDTSTSLLCELYISICPSLTHLSSTHHLPSTLTRLTIKNASNLRTLTAGGQLPKALKFLRFDVCPKLELEEVSFDNNMSLEYVSISRCESVPEGLHTLHNLSYIRIEDCRNLVSFPKDGLPDTELAVVIMGCEKLQALPSHMHTLKSLQSLTLSNNPKLVLFPEQDIPTNLTSLDVDDPKIYNSLAEWGFHKLVSLRELHIEGSPDAVSFPEGEKGMKLPASLIYLKLKKFPKLKFLSSKGFRNLSSLENLEIINCPNLTSLPHLPSSLLQLYIIHCLNLTSLPDLPSSLLQLRVSGCPLLKQRCKGDKGQEWPKITHIPRVEIDGKFIHDPEEEE